MSPALIGKNVIDMKDKSEDPAKATILFKEFTEVAKTKGSGWVGYMWANPGDPKPVITSYSIHYTKLYEKGPEAMLPWARDTLLCPLPCDPSP